MLIQELLLEKFFPVICLNYAIQISYQLYASMQQTGYEAKKKEYFSLLGVTDEDLKLFPQVE